MTQTLLIQPSELNSYRNLSLNLNDISVVRNYILDAQEFDLRSFLGDDMYIDLLDDFNASPALHTYANVFYGCTYSYGNRNFKHEGIIAMLAHFAYARYVLKSNVTSTATGFVVKTNDWSTPASDDMISRISNSAKSMAIQYQQRLKQYLDLNYKTYPKWRFGFEKKRTQIRITPVGGNSIGRYRCQRCNRIGCDGNCNYNKYNEPEITI